VVLIVSDRLLVVEDNKTLAKLIVLKLRNALKVEVDVAHSLSEAKLFFARYKYFITLLDVNLPDAPDGEIIDYALSKQNRVLVLSGNIDKEFRKKILQKKVIDYVSKSGADDIDYIISTIERLKKNQKHKVLVVDDSIVFREEMKRMLENLFFNVITVAHGEEAMGMLMAQPDISLIITDYIMPVMDGLELTRNARKKFSKNELCILALSVNADEEVNALFLKHGANDYIKKPFSKEEFSCRINNAIEALENIQTITNYANRDFLTGLYNRRYFYRNMDEYIQTTQDTQESFAVAMFDIDHFKKVNDTYGHDMGDKVIIAIADILKSSVNPDDIVARFGGEEFCLVLKNVNSQNTPEILQRVRQSVENYSFEIEQGQYINITVSIGAVIHDYANVLNETINQADMLLYKAKNNGRNQLVFGEA